MNARGPVRGKRATMRKSLSVEDALEVLHSVATEEALDTVLRKHYDILMGKFGASPSSAHFRNWYELCGIVGLKPQDRKRALESDEWVDEVITTLVARVRELRLPQGEGDKRDE